MHRIKVPGHFDRIARGVNNISFIGLEEEKTKSGSKASQTILNVFPNESNAEKGLCYDVYLDRFMEYLFVRIPSVVYTFNLFRIKCKQYDYT